MKALLLFFLFCLPSVAFLQTTCATATNLTAPATFTSGILTGTGATQPGATASRWYKYTPTSSGMLQISSCSGGSDTRLWIWSGNCGNLQAVASNDDFAGCISTGASEYASRIQNLILLAGTTYYFEWDNYWENTSFTWSFTYSALPNNNDIGVLSVLNPYTRIPITQAASGIQLGARLKNYSAAALTSVALLVEIYELPNTSAPIASFSSNPQTLNVGAELDFIAGTWAPVLSVSKTYQIKYTKTQPQLDAVGSNDQQIQTLVLDYNYLARDNGTYNAAFNWSTTSDYVQATRFTINGADNLTGFRYYLQSPSTTQNYHIQLYNVQGGQIDTSPFWESPAILASGAGWQTYNLPSSITLAPGTYAMGIYKSGTTPFPVGCATSLFRNQASYIRVGSGAWNPMEAYSLSYVFMLRPKFGPDPAVDIAIVDHQNPGGVFTTVSTRQHPNGTALNFSLRAQNNGASTTSAVQLKVTVKNAAQQVVYSATSSPYTIAANQLDTLEVPSFTIAQLGAYTIDYEVLCPGDAQPINNFVSTTFERSTNRLAEHVGVGGGVGIGNNLTSAYDNGIIGQNFSLPFADILDSVRFVLRPGTPANQPVRVEIYACSAQGIPTGAPLAQSANFTTTTAHATNGVTLSLPLTTGALSLSPGTYFIGITEQAGNLQLGSSALYYQPNNTFRRWNQNPYGAATWSPLEQFNLFVALAITPVFKPCLPLALNEQIQQATCGQNNGSITFAPTGFSGQISYAWTPNIGNSLNLNNLAPGTYNCSLQDENNCQLNFSTTLTLQSTAPILNIDSLANIACFGNSSGAIFCSANAGLAPYQIELPALSLQGPSFSNLPAGTYTVQLTDANSCVAQQTLTLTQPPLLALNAQITQAILCFGDSTAGIQLLPSGGVGPYSMLWPGLQEDSLLQTGLPAGTYLANLTDANNCTASISTTITQPPALVLNVLAQSNSTCAGANNGSISVLASGGIAPYSYFCPSLAQAGQQLNNLAPASYLLQAQDQNGCIETLNVSITEPVLLQAQLVSAQNPTCFGLANGQITVAGSGGTAPYAFQWLPLQSNQTQLQALPAGTFTCILTDANACQTQLSHTLQNPPILQMSLLSSQPAFCGQANGGLSVAISGGTGPLQAVWNNNQLGSSIVNVLAGSYQLQLTDSLGCNLSQSFSVPNVNGPTLNPGSSVIPTCYDAQNGQLSATVLDPLALQSITWTPAPALGQGTLQIANIGVGSYVCTVVDTNACVASLVLNLSAPAPLNLALQAITNVSCAGGTNGSIQLMATGGTAPYNYTWPNLSGATNVQTGLSAGSQLCIVTDVNNCTDSLVTLVTEPTPVLAQVQVLQAPTCSYSQNGVLQASGQGGTAPYTYLWQGNQQTSPTLIGIGTSPQTVVVSDALNCMDTLEFLPNSLSNTNVQMQITPVTCAGYADGQLELTVTSGQAPYLISWSNGQTGMQLQNLQSGNYSAYVFDNLGCLDTAQVNLPTLSLLSATVSGTPIICAGTNTGELTVLADQGVLPYDLYLNGQLQTSLTPINLLAGSYELVVMDSLGCSDSLEFQIDSSLFNVSALALPTLCQGVQSGSVYLTATNGIQPYFYAWPGFLENTDSLLGLSSGYIHFEVSDAMNCSISDSIFVGVQQSIQLSAVVSPELFGQDGAIDLTPSGTSAPYFYQWSNGLDTQDLTGLTPGWYIIAVNDQNGCFVEDSFFVDTELGLASTDLPSVLIAPNPFSESITVSGSGISELAIYDLRGVLVWQSSLQPSQVKHHIDLSNLPSGSYVVQIIQQGTSIKQHILRL